MRWPWSFEKQFFLCSATAFGVKSRCSPTDTLCPSFFLPRHHCRCLTMPSILSTGLTTVTSSLYHFCPYTVGIVVFVAGWWSVDHPIIAVVVVIVVYRLSSRSADENCRMAITDAYCSAVPPEPMWNCVRKNPRVS